MTQTSLFISTLSSILDGNPEQDRDATLAVERACVEGVPSKAEHDELAPIQVQLSDGSRFEWEGSFYELDNAKRALAAQGVHLIDAEEGEVRLELTRYNATREVFAAIEVTGCSLEELFPADATCACGAPSDVSRAGELWGMCLECALKAELGS